MATTYLLRTPSSATNQKTCTLSVWIKRSAIGVRQAIASQTVDGSNETFIWFDTNDELFLKESGEATYEFRTNRKFRDTSAWYHIVMAIDTTQSSGGNRVKLYVNGIQETSWASATDPALNDDTRWNSTTPFNIGRMNYGSEYFDGAMSHIHFIDGTAYDASAFGETDATTGEWKIKTSPSVTYGTNGFFILKDGDSVTDQSGNSNNFTVIGEALTKTEDSPSNVFNVLNPLSAHGSSLTFRKANTEINFDATATWHAVYSTLGATSGKYYAECLIDAVGGETSIGIIPVDTVSNVQYTGPGDYMGKEANSIGYVNNGTLYKSNSVQESTSTYTNADIISFIFDLDNNTIQFYKNDSSVGSAISLPSNTTYMIGGSGYNGSRQRWNFGNGFFGKTAVASAGTNASGNGIFEYDVPTGYTALSTKGLNL